MPRPGDFSANISWDEYRDRINAGAIVIVPVGAHEQHGHHLPLGTDTTEVTGICEQIAEHLDVVITPTIPFGFKSQPRSSGGNAWPGNIAFDGQTLVLVVRDVVCAVAAHGARRIVVMDSHFENGWFLVEACDLAAREIDRAGIKDVRILKMLSWDALSGEALRRVYGKSDGLDLSLEHAGILETSTMLHLAPELVHMRKRPVHSFPRGFPPYDLYPPNQAWLTESGSLSDPSPAKAEFGAIFVDDLGKNLAQMLREAFELEPQAS